MTIKIEEDENNFVFAIEDDAGGIRQDILEKIFDPFVTTRDKKIRKVGLGLPFLKQATESTGGSVELKTELGKGTIVKAHFVKSHIDCQPVGDLAGTFFALLLNTNVNWKIERCLNDDCYEIDSQTLKNYLGEIDSPEKMNILKDLLYSMEEELRKVEG